MEVTHSLNRFYFHVTPLDAQLNEYHKEPSPVQLFIKFDYYIKHKYFNVSQDHRTRTLIHGSEERTEAVHQSDLCQLDQSHMNNDSYKNCLFYILSELGIDENNHNAIVNEITDWGRIIDNLEYNKDRKILSLWVYIASEHITFRCERCLTERESLIKKKLKRVRVVKDNEMEYDDDNAGDDEEDCEERNSRSVVRESEICSICMEEFAVLDDVFCTPCWHMFHDKCIVRWLGEKLHCPLCRFQMPIEHRDCRGQN
ncbi:hypothetical protein ABKV19_000431 [Rosa sericea]